jgi:hypothetical protein
VVEGARLERVCARKGTQGSNPCLSANKKAHEFVSFFVGRGRDPNPKGFGERGTELKRSSRDIPVFLTIFPVIPVTQAITLTTN